MPIEIAGMTYTRKPVHGEKITLKMHECGNFITAKVFAGDELIAFDNIAKSSPKREDIARGAREKLLRRAGDHWRKNGFEVDE